MPDGMYFICALIPPATPYSRASAIEHFRSLGLRSEQTQSDASEGGFGFRVYYGDWAIDAWEDESPKVLRESAELAAGPFLPLPVPAEVIASCNRELSLWSDPDPGLEHYDDWISYVEELLHAFPGMIVFDPVTGKWWK